MNTLNREKLAMLAVIGDETRPGTLGAALDELSEAREGDLADVKAARAFLHEASSEYFNTVDDICEVSWKIPVSHTEFRELREAAQGLKMAMEGLVQYDNSCAPLLSLLDKELSPILQKRVDKHRAEAQPGDWRARQKQQLDEKANELAKEMKR